MKSTPSSVIDGMTPSDREALARLYDTPAYEALKRLLNAERLNTATKLVDIDPTDVVAIARHQGRADNCKRLHQTLRANYRAQNALEKRKPKKAQKT
jgi:hypothetical protein